MAQCISLIIFFLENQKNLSLSRQPPTQFCFIYPVYMMMVVMVVGITNSYMWTANHKIWPTRFQPGINITVSQDKPHQTCQTEWELSFITHHPEYSAIP
jgi:hypothetical protein